MAMDLLGEGIDRSVIALWLGHESVGTMQIYFDAVIPTKVQALAKASPPHGNPRRYRPGDQLPGCLSNRRVEKTMSSDGADRSSRRLRLGGFPKKSPPLLDLVRKGR